jgi:WD40 repeat protein
MLASAIRELAVSKNPQWIAAAHFEKTIEIWESNSLDRITEFSAVFCSGARNLALAPTAEILVTGLSRNHGKVAAYQVPSGRKLWERNLTYPSKLKFGPSGDSILCTINQRSVLRLDVQTGDIFETIEGTRQYLEDLNGDVLTVPANKEEPICLIREGRAFNLYKPSRWVLDAQFSPCSVCLSEANGPVRCVSRVDGKLQWTFDPGATSHVVGLHYSPGIDAFFGVLFNFENGVSRTLIQFDPTSGKHQQVCEFHSWEEAFLGTTDQIVTSAGEIRNLSNGELVGRLPFPQKEYPGG